MRFRSLEEWRSALLTLPDNAYFDLMRSIFGNIKTPFSKQRLMDDLAALLSQEDIRQTIAAYIDERDHRVIAAVALLEEPSARDLESFFAGELSGVELHPLLLNLEERFILFRFRDEGLYRLTLNPALETVLAPYAADTSVLFPSLPGAGDGGSTEGAPPAHEGSTLGGAPLERGSPGELPGSSPPGGFEDRNLAAFLAFVFEEREFFRAGSGIRRRVLDAGKLLFPEGLLPALAGTLLCLGILEREGEELRVSERRLKAFAARSPRERREYCAAGLYRFREEEAENSGGGAVRSEPFLPVIQRNRVRDLAALVHRFLTWLEPGRRYSPEVLKRMAGILAREENRAAPGGGIFEGGFASGNGGSVKDPAKAPGGLPLDRFLLALEETGLLFAAGEGLWEALPPDQTAPAEGSRGMVMDTPLSCLLYPELPFAGALSLARFCSPRDTGAVLRFELTRSSVARGFDRGISAAAMLEILTRLSGNRVDGNLGWTLQDWESRYAAVSLHQGLVLTLAEDRRYLAGTEPLAALIRLSLAPGVYLLSVSDSAPALEALKKAGVDMVARREWGLSPEESPGDGSLEGLASPFPPLGRPEEPLVEPPLPGTRPSPKIPPKGPLREGPEGLKERFHAALDRLSIPKQERDELAARIERRLVLRESQMEGAVIRYEKLEARGLDYVGKAAIAKQAIAAKSPVDVLWTRAGGGSGQILGVPTALVKQEGESVLVLNPLPAGEELRLPLGKISLIRRIKQSIFET